MNSAPALGTAAFNFINVITSFPTTNEGEHFGDRQIGMVPIGRNGLNVIIKEEDSE